MHKITIVICLLPLLQAILFHLPDYGTQCYYSELQADSVTPILNQLHQISIELKDVSQTACQIELTIDEQNEEEDESQYSINRVRTALFCNDTKKPYHYKASGKMVTSLKRLRVCMISHEVVNNLAIQFKIHHHENPHFDDDANLSLVSSNELRTLHDLVHNTTNKMMELERLQESLDLTEEQLSKANDELKDRIQTLGVIQLVVMLLMGGLWILIMSRANR